MRPIAGDERAREREIQSHRKTQAVEPGGMGRKYMFLPGETSRMRMREESAEVVVVMMARESGSERRTEEL